MSDTVIADLEARLSEARADAAFYRDALVKIRDCDDRKWTPTIPTSYRLIGKVMTSIFRPMRRYLCHYKFTYTGWRKVRQFYEGDVTPDFRAELSLEPDDACNAETMRKFLQDGLAKRWPLAGLTIDDVTLVSIQDEGLR